MCIAVLQLVGRGKLQFDSPISEYLNKIPETWKLVKVQQLVIVILLGTILSRAVVGASPFLPVISTCTVIVVLHRFLSWHKMKSNYFNRLMEGKRIIVFENDRFKENNLHRALLRKEDVMQELRKSTQNDDLRNIKRIFIERSGKISFVKKSTNDSGIPDHHL